MTRELRRAGQWNDCGRRRLVVRANVVERQSERRRHRRAEQRNRHFLVGRDRARFSLDCRAARRAAAEGRRRQLAGSDRQRPPWTSPTSACSSSPTRPRRRWPARPSVRCPPTRPTHGLLAHRRSARTAAADHRAVDVRSRTSCARSQSNVRIRNDQIVNNDVNALRPLRPGRCVRPEAMIDGPRFGASRRRAPARRSAR